MLTRWYNEDVIALKDANVNFLAMEYDKWAVIYITANGKTFIYNYTRLHPADMLSPLYLSEVSVDDGKTYNTIAS